MNRSYDLSSRASHQSGVIKTQREERRTTGRRVMDHALIGKHPIASSIFRSLLYVTITAGVLKTILYATQHMDAEIFFAENGMIEWFQLGLLMSCAVMLKLASIQMQELRQGFHMLALLPLIASVRELDNVLDTYVFDGAWQLLVTGLLLYAFAFARKNYQVLRQQILYIFSFPPIGLLVSGFITVIVFSRLLGQQLFWQTVLQEEYLRLVGRVVEESCESFGYLLLLFGCIEFLIFAFSSRSNRHSSSEKINV